MDYEGAVEWLYGLQIYGIKLGLENMGRLCAGLGVDLASGAKRKFIHVAGTNGKGSVCAMAAAILCAAGQRTGLYTSPHLVSFRERIRLGPNLIPEEHVAEILSDIRKLTRDWEHLPTFFEVTTALALLWFQRQRAEWVVLETGLGGRLDATNVVTPAVSVITSVGFDHTQHLGTTLAEIAAEKAGIIKPGVPVITSGQQPEAMEVLRSTAKAQGAKLKEITKPVPKNIDVHLAGSHQRVNAAIAFASVVAAGLRPDPKAVGKALAKVDWPGRFQRLLGGRVILDGAHNPEAAARLVQTWNEEYPGEKVGLTLGVLADKDVPGICRQLAEIAAEIWCLPVRSPRALAPEELMRIVKEVAPGIPCRASDSAEVALAEAAEGGNRVLVAGSLFLVGEVLSVLGHGPMPQISAQ